MDKRTGIAAILMIALFIGAVVWRNNMQSDLKKSGVIVLAKIIGVNYGGKVSGGFQCLIDYEGQKLKIPSPSSVKSGKFKLIGKTFPAIYSPNTNALEILITEVDFNKFDLPFPDSLNWTWEYNLEIRE